MEIKSRRKEGRKERERKRGEEGRRKIKLQSNIFHEYNAEILNKMIKKKVLQQYTKVVVYHCQVGFISKMQGEFNI